MSSALFHPYDGSGREIETRAARSPDGFMYVAGIHSRAPKMALSLCMYVCFMIMYVYIPFRQGTHGVLNQNHDLIYHT